MTLLERGIAQGGVSLSGLFAASFEPGLAQGLGLSEIADAICVGGWPALVGSSPEDAAVVVEQYLGALFDLSDGRWAAIEVKLGEDKVPKGIANLKRLASKVATNPAARNPAPEFMMVLTATSPIWRRDEESGVYVVPLTALEP